MVRRDMSLTRLELLEYRDSLFALLDRLTESVDSGDWPAVVSDGACSECPCIAECPIPVELRDHRGTISTPEEAAEAFAVREIEQREMRARSTELRKWLEANGGRLVFDGKVAEIVLQESERIGDREAMFTAMQRAAEFGETFDRAQFVKTVQSFPLKTRDLTADEAGETSNNGGAA